MCLWIHVKQTETKQRGLIELAGFEVRNKWGHACSFRARVEKNIQHDGNMLFSNFGKFQLAKMMIH